MWHPDLSGVADQRSAGHQLQVGNCSRVTWGFESLCLLYDICTCIVSNFGQGKAKCIVLVYISVLLCSQF